MAFRYSTGLFNAIQAAIKTQMDGGSIELYTGSQPASPDAAVTGTLIARVTLNGGAWSQGTLTNGLVFDTPSGANMDIPAGAVWQFTAIADGTIGWGRFRANPVDSGSSSTTLKRMDFSVGTTTGDMKMSKVTYQTGETGLIQDFLIPLSNVA